MTKFKGNPVRVLALASQKGGSGKTTLSGHLAVQAQLAGAGPVVLIDIDPQGSLADWWNERETELPAFAQTTVARLASDLEILRQQGFKLAVIDTPPAITMAIQSVIGVAELIVVPTRPSPHDLRAVGATLDIVEGRNKPLTISFEPGEKFGYSGEGYTYLQNVIEHVTAEPLAEFLRKRALAPLGMESSSFVWRPDYDARAAIGHDRGSPQEKWRPNVAFAAGTLHTTATDYAKFLAAMIRPRKGVGLDEAWLRRMLTPASRIDDSLSWGLGWGIEKHSLGQFFWQWGDDGEFKAFAAGTREPRGVSGKKAVVILTNSASGLRVCRPIIEHALGGSHSFLSYSMVNY